jgi:hypothetical protein
MADARQDGWLDVLDEIDKKHQSGHDRLRLDLRELERRVENNFVHFATITDLHRSKINPLDATTAAPVNASKLVLTTTQIVAVVGACLVIAATSWRLSEKIDTQSAKMDASQRLYDVQLASMQQSIRETSARYELLRIEVQSLKETVIGKGKQP